MGRSFEGKLSFVLTLRLKFVTSPVVKQVPGLGHMTAQLRQLKFHSNHTQSVGFIRRSEKNRKCQTNFLSGKFHQFTASQL